MKFNSKTSIITLLIIILVNITNSTFHSSDRLENETLETSLYENLGQRNHKMVDMGNNIYGVVYTKSSKTYATFIKNGNLIL